MLALILAVAMVAFIVACAQDAPAPAAPAAPEPAPAPEDPAPAPDAPADPPPPTDESVKIGVSIMELTAYTWYLGVIEGVEQWGRENPQANFEFSFEDSRSDVPTMINNIENLILWGAQGMILFPADASSAIPLMQRYVGEGIPFVTGDFEQDPSSPDDVVWSTHIGHDMRALGVSAAEIAIEYLETLGKDDPVCLFIWRPLSGQVGLDRLEGFTDTVLAAFPNARIIDEGDIGPGDPVSAQALMENIMQRESVIDVVAGHNDALVIGAYNGAVAAGRNEIRFIGLGGMKEVLTFIDEGNEMWLGEVLQDPVVLGYLAAEAIYRAMQGETLPPKYDLPPPIAVTPVNIGQFDWKTWPWL